MSFATEALPTTCAICYDDLNANDTLRFETCGHAFHSGCALRWVTTNNPYAVGEGGEGASAPCPLCRGTIPGSALQEAGVPLLICRGPWREPLPPPSPERQPPVDGLPHAPKKPVRRRRSVD